MRLHVFPVDDVREHIAQGFECWCHPYEDDDVIVHHKEDYMANVYEGKPDARQEGEIKPSIFRPRYRSLTDEEVVIHDEIKAKAEELLKLFDFVEDGRYKSLAITSLEQSIMWIVKELTR